MQRHSVNVWTIIIIIIIIIIIKMIIIYHDFFPPPRRGSHAKSDNTIIDIHPLVHILDFCAVSFSSCALFTVYPNRIMNSIPSLSR